MVLDSFGIDTGPLLEASPIEVGRTTATVLAMAVTGGIFLVVTVLMNRYGRGDDDTDLSDIY